MKKLNGLKHYVTAAIPGVHLIREDGLCFIVPEGQTSYAGVVYGIGPTPREAWKNAVLPATHAMRKNKAIVVVELTLDAIDEKDALTIVQEHLETAWREHHSKIVSATILPT